MASICIFDQSKCTGFSEMPSPPQRLETVLLYIPLILNLEIPLLPIFFLEYKMTTLL